MVDKVIAQSALCALNRHLWYLTAEMVILALFSQKVPQDECRAIADAMIAIKPATDMQGPVDRFGAGWGKPKFPSVVIDASTRLCEFVGVDSWFTVHRLKLDTSFLAIPVAEWERNAAFIASSVNVAAVNVINDCAERGIKLSSDFVSTARSEEHYQNVLQVVERDRKEEPNLRRKRRAQPY